MQGLSCTKANLKQKIRDKLFINFIFILHLKNVAVPAA